ncbi:hypothetical protein JHK82_042942 [Glycine max]|nr:hypothetical protein JHK82_042942 [Glycine max]
MGERRTKMLRKCIEERSFLSLLRGGMFCHPPVAIFLYLSYDPQMANNSETTVPVGLLDDANMGISA